MRIAGKVAFITGASEGIGAAMAAEFRRRGARLALMARSEEKLRKQASNDDVAIAGDVTDAAAREQAVKRALERFGAIDILINNAGRGLYSPSWQAPLPEARAMFELNFFAPVAMTQLVVPGMRERGSGTIVNVGSIAGKVTLPWFTLYSASKYALGSFTDGLRMELKPHGIHAMTVCPGYVKTGFQQNVALGAPPDRVLKGRSTIAITPEQCARAVANGVERGARTVVTPWLGWLFVAAERLFPSLIDGRMAAAIEDQGGWS
jgi:short-subunit dehydrogenase